MNKEVGRVNNDASYPIEDVINTSEAITPESLVQRIAYLKRDFFRLYVLGVSTGSMAAGSV